MDRIGLLFLGLFLSLSTLSAAEKLYRYNGEDGTPTFSDRPMDEGTLETVSQVAPQDYRLPVRIENTGTESQPVITAWNGSLTPVELRIEGDEIVNARTAPSLPRRVVVPPQREVELFRAHPINPTRGWGYGYQAKAVIGDPTAMHDTQTPYLPPFQLGERYLITQAYPSTYTHNHAQSHYAIDIAMPEGTPICAARHGIVVEVAQDFINGGVGESYEARANFIRLLHDDGTMAVYAHLQLESVAVLVGNRVAAGEVIAYSGNTGFSTGPHLHFVVQKNQGMKLVSVPIEFESGPPREGEWMMR